MVEKGRELLPADRVPQAEAEAEEIDRELRTMEHVR